MTTTFPVDCQPLHAIVGSHPITGVVPSPRTVFVLEKAQRDRLVLLDTQLAPFIRRYSLADDIQRYGMVPSQKFLLCLPAGWTVQHCQTTAIGNDAWQCIAERYPALARHLAIPVAKRHYSQPLVGTPQRCHHTPPAATNVYMASSTHPSTLHGRNAWTCQCESMATK
jgi:hypothetical protein